MAVLIPRSPKDCTYSEKLVVRRLGTDLPGQAVVLHSLGLPGHKTKIWGEADILVVAPEGIFALEVKGGSVQCRDGVWTFGEGASCYTKTEDPWTQAKGTMMAVKEILQKPDGEFRNTLFGFGVVMPMIRFEQTGAEIVQEVLLDSRRFGEPLGLYISRLADYWRGQYMDKQRRSLQGLTPQQIPRVQQLLRPNVQTVISLGGHLTGVETQLLELTEGQVKASKRMSANPRTIVRGSAGTGKSVIAAERARQLAAQGLRVLYLCYNQMLATHVHAGLSVQTTPGAIDVRHAHGLYHEIITDAGLGARLDACRRDEDFFARRFPDLVMEAYLESKPPVWDALIVDEAQDMLTPEHLDVMDLMLQGGLKGGRWHLFLDPLQNLYSADIQAQVDQRLAPLNPAYDDLTDNCRNTRQVAVLASLISSIDVAYVGAPDGPKCHTYFPSGRTALLAKLEERVAELLRHDVRPQDIAILSTRRRENSTLNGVERIAGVPLVDIADAAALRSGAVVFSTMHAFKGLERLVVLAVDMNEIGDQKWRMLHYAGLSRARGLLEVFMPLSRQDTYGRLATEFGRKGYGIFR